MQVSSVGSLLDDDLRGALGVLAGIGTAVGVCLFLIAAAPVAVLVAAFGLVTPSAPAAPNAALGRVDLPVIAMSNGAGENIVDVARRYLGVRYVFGGTNPAIGLDCSGLVQLVYRQVGLTVPRTAQQQYDATVHLSPDQLQPGDLVFFARTYPDPRDWVTHVGIYIGGGMQINAPTEGQVVSIQPVFSGFWGAHFLWRPREDGAVNITTPIIRQETR